ncbi:hypothetical protein DMENIID0001_094710 [Sergentomyia squamirostris]
MKLIALGVFLLACLEISSGAVDEVYNWKQVFYENLPYEANFQIGKYPYYIPENNDVLAVNYHVASGLAITNVGRVRSGIPSSLNAFCAKDYPDGTTPYLWAFPDYKKNTIKPTFYSLPPHDDIWSQNNTVKKSSTGFFSHYYSQHYTAFSGDQKYPHNSFYNPLEDINIVSVHRSEIDNQCNRLFAIDTGVLHYGANEVYDVQRPAILVFDLPSDGCATRRFPVLRRVEIPDNLYKNPSGFLYITLDFKSNTACDDVVLYISNLLEGSLLAYDYKTGEFWPIQDPSMNAIFAESKMLFDGHYSYDLPVGIINVVLSYPDVNGNRVAYFGPGSSTSEYAVSTAIFKNAKTYPYKYTPGDFALIGHRGCGSQTFKQVIDLTTGVIFFGELQSRKIRCWNTQLPLNPDNIGVVFESDRLLCASDMSLDASGYLWFQSSHMPLDFLTDLPLNVTEINSRTFRIKATEAIKGTVCDTAPLYRPEDVY